MNPILLEILKIIGYIGVFLIILYLAQFTSKYLVQKNEALYRNKKVKIIEKICIGKEKEILLLNYKEKEYLIGISANNIVKLDTFKSKDDKNEEI